MCTLAMLEERIKDGSGSRPALEVTQSFFLGGPLQLTPNSPLPPLSGLFVLPESGETLAADEPGDGVLNERDGVSRDNKSSMFILKVKLWRAWVEEISLGWLLFGTLVDLHVGGVLYIKGSTRWSSQFFESRSENRKKVTRPYNKHELLPSVHN